MNASIAKILGVVAFGIAFQAYAAPEVSQGAQVTITNNKAKNITTGGGSAKAAGLAKLAGGSVNINSSANVNSVVLNDPDAKIKGKVTVSNNTAQDVTAIGGDVNVNSLILGR